MALSKLTRSVAALAAGLMVVGVASEAFAAPQHGRAGVRAHAARGNVARGHRTARRGFNPGPAVAGAALGIIGAAVAGAAADNYYNRPYYGGGGYYGPGPGYYGNGGYYGNPGYPY